MKKGERTFLSAMQRLFGKAVGRRLFVQSEKAREVSGAKGLPGDQEIIDGWSRRSLIALSKSVPGVLPEHEATRDFEIISLDDLTNVAEPDEAFEDQMLTNAPFELRAAISESGLLVREKTILLQICDGRTGEQIGDNLEISRARVSSIARSAERKLLIGHVSQIIRHIAEKYGFGDFMKLKNRTRGD